MDNPDLLILSDEGVILRRLFNFFAFRPLLVQTTPLLPNIIGNPTILTNPLNLPLMNPPTTIQPFPYVVYRISNLGEKKDHSLTLNKQTNFFFENGQFIPKITKVYYIGDGPLVFYIPRKFVNLPISLSYPTLQPFKYTNLLDNYMTTQQVITIPVSYNFWLSVPNLNNTSDINKEKTIKLPLKSLVEYKTVSDNDSIIIGFNTYVFKYTDDPSDINTLVEDLQPEQIYKYNSPDDIIKSTEIFSVVNDFGDLVSTKGTVFVYGKN